MSLQILHNARVWLCDAEGPHLSSGRTATDIIGDISVHVAASNALADFIYESDRGRHLWFVADLEALATRL